jgi:hypothetical protein
VRKFMVLAMSLATVFLLSFLALPTVSQGLAGTPPAKSGKSESPLKLTVKTDKGSYKSSSIIHISLVLKNPTKQAVPLTFATGQKYDIILGRTSGKETETVWQWSRDLMFTQMVTTTSLAAGKTMQFEATFPPKDSADIKPLTPGKYTVVGIITTMGAEPKPSGTAGFTVK